MQHETYGTFLSHVSFPHIPGHISCPNLMHKPIHIIAYPRQMTVEAGLLQRIDQSIWQLLGNVVQGEFTQVWAFLIPHQVH